MMALKIKSLPCCSKGGFCDEQLKLTQSIQEYLYEKF